MARIAFYGRLSESKFNMSFAGGNVHIYRHRGETFAQGCVLEHNRLGGGGIMVFFFPICKMLVFS